MTDQTAKHLGGQAPLTIGGAHIGSGEASDTVLLMTTRGGWPAPPGTVDRLFAQWVAAGRPKQLETGNYMTKVIS